MEARHVLESVFIQVSARGVPVAPRDYLDAVAALRRGFGLLTRTRLLALCKALWARSEDEAALVRAVFDEIAPPTGEEIAQALGEEAAVDEAPAIGDGPIP